MSAIVSLEKKGPIIYCMTDGGKAYQLDLSRGIVIGLNNRPLKSTKTIEQKVFDYNVRTNNSSPLSAVLRYFCNTPTCYGDERYSQVIDSILSYPDLLSGPIDGGFIYGIVSDYGGKLPKGYIKWLRANQRYIDSYSLREFSKWQGMAKWPQKVVDTIKAMSNGLRYDVFKFVGTDLDLARFIIQVTNNSLKRYEICDVGSYLRHLCLEWVNYPSLRPYFDSTKSAKVAWKIIQETKEKQRNDIILEKEAQLAPLHNMVVDGLMVFVPSAMDDFVNEGEQQHNCVGHFYHDSITQGKNLIYFLRLPDLPDKSYMTCRYSLLDKKTVEHRLTYNDDIEYIPALAKIDRMINELLGVEG